MKVNDVAVVALIASAGGAAGFSVNKPNDVSKGASGADEFVKHGIEALLGAPAPDFQMMAVSLVVMSILLFGGLVYFRKVETTFADVI